MKRSQFNKKNYTSFPYPNNIYGGEVLDRYLLLDDIKGKQILDVGCGTGELSCEMAKRGGVVLGIDYSEPSIVLAKQRSKNEDLKNIDFLCMNVTDLSKIRKKFDVVCCFGVLMYVDDPLFTFEELVRHTKSGGYINIAVYNKFGASMKRVKKKILDVLVGNKNTEKRVRLALKLFSKGRKQDKQLITKMVDTYCNKETLFSIGQIREWFANNSIEYQKSNPPIELKDCFQEKYLIKRPYLKQISFLGYIKNRMINDCLIQLGWIPTQREVFSVLGKKDGLLNKCNLLKK